MKYDSGDSANPHRRRGQEFSFKIRTDNIRTDNIRTDSLPPTPPVSNPATVRPFPVEVFDPQMPALPKLKRLSLSSHRHEANPALAMNLLGDIQRMVEQWQTELRRIILAIQALYMEGPLVDGWLESHVSGEPQVSASQANKVTDTSVLRYGDPEQLMNYVNDICEAQSVSSQSSQRRQAVDQAIETHYRLCSLDKEGKLQCRPCPADQLVVISMAISRYQKLRQLLNQKQYLESRLKDAVDILITARNDLRTSDEEHRN